MKDRMIIRHSETTDLPRMKEIFNIARQFMIESGNPNQWVDGYPDEEFLREDIEHGDSYVILADGQIVATFVLRAGKDPTYDVVYDGEWLNDEPYATIHRIAASGEVRGIMHAVMEYALERFDNIRIDTHKDNKKMQHLIMKEGFRYCGIIRCWSGAYRLAYQRVKQKGKYDKRQ